MPSAPLKGAFVSLGRAEHLVALRIPLLVGAVNRGSELGGPEHQGRDRRTGWRPAAPRRPAACAPAALG
jgi:hypothetical protein